jgi:hypothetical protein|tara:strand:- start:382 stop:1179 length:798 start_codon:yes stop_codon:yes gene_type:complete
VRFSKKLVRYIDRTLLGGNLQLLKAFILERHLRTYRNNELTSRFNTQYKGNEKSELNTLCDKYGSDKGEVTSADNQYPWPSHNYNDVYELLFRLCKDNVKSLIECGIGTNNLAFKSSMGVNGKPGASLRVWRDYFPSAKVIGIDIDKDILFSEDRIETYYCDQTDPKSIADFTETSKILEKTINIIIDDGLHEFQAGKIFFEGMAKYLAPNGIYIIEDVTPKNMLLYKDYFLTLTKKFSVQFFSLTRPGIIDVVDNRLIVINKIN